MRVVLGGSVDGPHFHHDHALVAGPSTQGPMRKKRTPLSFTLLGVGCLAFGISISGSVAPLRAQALEGDGCPTIGIRTDERPDPEGQPTEVAVAIFMVDLTKVDDVAQSLTADLLVIQAWTDPRLADLEGCQLPMTRIWHPQLDFLNSGRMEPKRSAEADQVEVGPGGSVVHQQRYYGSLASYHSLRDFPFDEQHFRISLLSPEYAEDEVLLVVNEAQTGKRDLLNISDWKVDSIGAEIGTYLTETIGRPLSTYEYRIAARRHVGFYIWKVIVPLILIVAMSWTVFWVSPAQFGPQIGLSATAMLTLIAFQFALVSVLPKLAYFTILDSFILGSTILVFLALVEAVAASFLVSKERTKTALRMDKISRWVFPFAFGALMIFVFNQ